MRRLCSVTTLLEFENTVSKDTLTQLADCIDCINLVLQITVLQNTLKQKGVSIGYFKTVTFQVCTHGQSMYMNS